MSGCNHVTGMSLGKIFFSFLKEYFTKRSKFCLLPSLPSICSNYLFLPCFAWSYEKRFANIRWQCKNKVNMPGMVEGKDGRSLGPWWHYRATDAILHLDLLLERNKPLFDETTAMQALCYLQLNDPKSHYHRVVRIKLSEISMCNCLMHRK